MEPPSSINQKESVTDPLADDPLPETLTPDSYKLSARAKVVSGGRTVLVRS